MTWEYTLIGLAAGIIIGAVAMCFGNRKPYQQQALQYELEKNKAELDEYREEPISYFACSVGLLDTMARGYRQLYQHTAKSSSSLLPELSVEANPFRSRPAKSEASNDQAPVQVPRDYPEGASGLLRIDARCDQLTFRAQPLRPPLLSLLDYHLIWCLIVSRLRIQ